MIILKILIILGLSFYPGVFMPPLAKDKIIEVNEPITIKVGMPSLPSKLDSSIINSLTEYILLEHLSIPLITYNTTGEITGVLAKSWDITDDFTKFTFTIDHNHKFSDGSVITGKNVVESIKRSMRETETIHYNFSNIKKIEEVSEFVVSITLKKRNPFFIFDLEHPEFRVLSANDSSLERYKQSFSISSGPYSLKKIDQKSIVLTKNPYHYYFKENKDSADIIVFINNNEMTNNKELFNQENVDLYWSQGHLNNEFDKYLQDQKYKKKIPRLSFSFWLSLNSNSKKLGNKKVRKFLQNILKIEPSKISDSNPLLQNADELYLPKGPGRLDQVELEQFWKEIKESKRPEEMPQELNILIFKHFSFLEEIKDKLFKAGIKANFHLYNNFTEYAEMIKDKNKFDIIQVNNDFSSIDLRSSLDVTLNPARPLIFPKESDNVIQDIMKKINETIENEKRYSYVEQLGHHVLNEGYIVPMYYFNTLVYHRPHLNLNNWSSIVTDTALWKIKVSKK